jgi:hypothetical protein
MAYNFHNLHWQGNCDFSIIRGNTIDPASDCGYFLDWNALTGDQILQGNCWIDPDPAAGNFPPQRAAVNDNVNNLLASEMGVDPSIMTCSPGYYSYPNYNGMNTSHAQGFWFTDFTGGPTYECAGLCSTDYQGEIDFSNYRMIAEDQPLTSGYVEESRRMMRAHLFEDLYFDNSLLEQDPLFEQFYNENQNTNMMSLASVKNQLNNNIYPQSLLAEYLAQSQSIAEIVAALSENEFRINYESLTQPEIDELQAVNQGFRDELQNQSEALMQWKINTFNYSQEQAMLVMNEVMSFSEEDKIEENHRNVYQIYLRSVAENNEITQDEQEVLMTIATQCPDQGGEAVIDARILLDKFYPEIDYAELTDCSETSGFRTGRPDSQDPKQHENLMICHLSPNPASDFIKINYTIMEPAELSFYSVTGQQIHSVQLAAGSRVDEIDTAPFARGVYSWKLQNGNATKNGKLFIMK